MLTLVIPTVGDPAQSTVLASWFKGVTFPCFVQFVFLLNPMKQPSGFSSRREMHDTCEVIHVSSDRYFGSCEENISRVADFLDILGEYFLIVGEHDNVNWQELACALEAFESMRLDALAININCCQRNHSGGFDSLSALLMPEGDSRLLRVVRSLFDGEPMGSAIAFPALISCFGPIDWAAYIGSHVYRKEVLRRILMYKTTESVYSLVCKQLQFFCESDVSYGLFSGMPLDRISNDFLKIRERSHRFGWLENHRTVRGLSPCFWIANLEYINQLGDTTLALLVIYSRCLSIVPLANEGQAYRSHFFLPALLSWCLQVLRHKIHGRSHSFPSDAISGDLGDLYSIATFLKRMTHAIQSDCTLCTLHGHAFLALISSASVELHTFLIRPSAPVHHLVTTYGSIEAACGSLKPDQLGILNDYALSRFDQSRFC